MQEAVGSASKFFKQIFTKKTKLKDEFKMGFGIRGSQRYKCINCNYNFIEGDKRIDPSIEIKKALSVLLYSTGKASFNYLGKLFNVDRSLVYRWINQVAKHLPNPEISSSIKEIEFDDNSRAIATHSIKK